MRDTKTIQMVTEIIFHKNYYCFLLDLLLDLSKHGLFIPSYVPNPIIFGTKIQHLQFVAQVKCQHIGTTRLKCRFIMYAFKTCMFQKNHPNIFFLNTFTNQLILVYQVLHYEFVHIFIFFKECYIYLIIIDNSYKILME